MQFDAEQEAIDEALEPLRALDSLLRRARDILEERQRYKDSKAKAVDRSLCKDDEEHQRAQEWVESHRDRYEDPAAFWQKVQNGWVEEMRTQEAELALVRSRSGRFEGSTDEEVAEMAKSFEAKIEGLRRYIADESQDAQIERLLVEAREKAALVDDETRRKYEEAKQKMGQGLLDAGFFP